jgi:hypothetical protein
MGGGCGRLLPCFCINAKVWVLQACVSAWNAEFTGVLPYCRFLHACKSICKMPNIVMSPDENNFPFSAYTVKAAGFPGNFAGCGGIEPEFP